IGDLPPGMALDPGTGVIDGNPFANGTYPFLVEVSDSNGNINTKDFTICVMEIVTGPNLPAATEGVDYATPLVEEPGSVSSEKWTLVGGTLPPGITLASNGALIGTPTEVDTFEFELQVEADCGGAVARCRQVFSLEVQSGVDCMGEADAIQDAVWTQISPPAAGNMNIAAGDGSVAWRAPRRR